MIKLLTNIAMLSVLTAILSTSCSKKQAAVSDDLIIGSDTVSVAHLLKLDPGAADSATILRNAVMRYLWKNSSGSKPDDATLKLFGERLLLVSGNEWEPSAAQLLLLSASVVAAIDTGKGSCQHIATTADSICRSATGLLKGKVTITCPDSQVLDSLTDCSGTEIRIGFFVRCLGVQEEVARLCHEFLYPSVDTTAAASAASVKNMVAGLVFKGNPDSVTKSGSPAKHDGSSPRKTSSVSATPPKKFNMELRNEQSVRDSISRHIPEIRQLYKKFLKADAALEGKLVVTFQVAADGSVAHADVRSSTLGTSPFVSQFLVYSKTIRFKPAPENAGVMTFDFPFEFNAEM